MSIRPFHRASLKAVFTLLAVTIGAWPGTSAAVPVLTTSVEAHIMTAAGGGPSSHYLDVFGSMSTGWVVAAKPALKSLRIVTKEGTQVGVHDAYSRGTSRRGRMASFSVTTKARLGASKGWTVSGTVALTWASKVVRYTFPLVDQTIKLPGDGVSYEREGANGQCKCQGRRELPSAFRCG